MGGVCFSFTPSPICVAFEEATGISLPDELKLSHYNAKDLVILKLVSCNSDDTILLEEDLSPSAKRQKQDRDAVRVCRCVEHLMWQLPFWIAHFSLYFLCCFS